MNAMNRVVELLSLSAYGIGNSACACPSGGAWLGVARRPEDFEDRPHPCPFSIAAMLEAAAGRRDGWRTAR